MPGAGRTAIDPFEDVGDAIGDPHLGSGIGSSTDHRPSSLSASRHRGPDPRRHALLPSRARSRDPRFYRPERHVEDPRDLFVIELPKIRQ